MPFAAVGAIVGVAGLGMSAASAAGAFNGPVDKRYPTIEEMAARNDAKKTYKLGREIQAPLDALAREDLKYLGSDQAMANAGSAGVNQLWQQAGPQFGTGLQQAAAQSGGPGSGRHWSQLGQGTSALDAGVRQANLQGRLGGLNQYLARQGQFLGRRTNDLQTGMAGMTAGGAQGMQNQNARINAQVQNNIATSQAMSSVGGSMMGAGMGMVSAGGGMQGIQNGFYGIGNWAGGLI